MEDEIDLLFGQEDKIGNVVPDEAIIFVPCQMADVCHIPSDQIVDRDDAMAFGQEAPPVTTETGLTEAGMVECSSNSRCRG